MMAKRREDRYNDVEELLIDLEALREGKPPVRARQRFDVSMLEQLEEGDAVETREHEYGEELYRVALLILGTISAISVLIIVLMLVF